MESNKILSANLLDLVFDDRNKSYGAYELRKHYHRRIVKALLFTGGIMSLIFAGTVLENSLRPKDSQRVTIRSVDVLPIPDEVTPTPPPTLPPTRHEPPPTIRTEQFSNMIIEDDEEVETPAPTQDDLANAGIDVIKTDGVEDQGLVATKTIDVGKGIIESDKNKTNDPFTTVQVPARFNGNWEKFLTRNLNAEVPIGNGAPAGKYSVIIQFVVDIDGTVSDIRALSSNGYGMEEEAIRVLKKASKWEPAIQNGMQVKAYRKQPIIFQVTNE